MPRASTSNNRHTRFARSRGAWITKTRAYEDYSLGPTDLNSILPTSIDRRNGNGPGLIHKYNLCDVKLIRAKVAAMVQTLQVGVPDGDTVPEHGQTIVRTQAKKDYKLHDNQIDRIRPCRIVPNPHRPSATPMRIYNVSDVQALAHGIEGLADMPAPENARIAHDAIPYGDPSDPDYNIFDGMPWDDAAALLAFVTNP